MRIICAGLLVLLATLSAYAIVHAYPTQPVTVCYQTDGSTITTAYVDQGATSYYPIESFESVEATADGFVARQETWFERREFTTFVPVVLR